MRPLSTSRIDDGIGNETTLFCKEGGAAAAGRGCSSFGGEEAGAEVCFDFFSTATRASVVIVVCFVARESFLLFIAVSAVNTKDASTGGRGEPVYERIKVA